MRRRSESNTAYSGLVEFRRITSLPPYVFTIIDGLKVEARRAGEDVIDLGFGNPDLPSPQTAVEKLCEAVHNTRNHRYSASRGIPKLREAVADLYLRRFGVALDPETEIITTIGAKEGFSHLMWVLLQPGDAALVPSPSYPIHIWGPLFAGADVREIPLGTGEDFFENLQEAYEYSWPKPRVIVLSFPHNPTTTCVDLDFMQRVVDFAREKDVVLVHDNAYAELGFDGYRAAVDPAGRGGQGVRGRAVLDDEVVLDGRLAHGLPGRQPPRSSQALAKLKTYLDYGTFQPIQIAATVTLNEASEHPQEVQPIYQARRDALCDGLNRIGWEMTPPRGTMFVWAPIPEPYREMGSVEFASFLVREAQWPRRPASASGPAATGTCASPSSRTSSASSQAIRNLRKALTKLG